MMHQKEHFFNLPTCYIHVIMRANELDKDGNILDPRHLSAIYQNIQEYYKRTQDAQDRAYALSTVLNSDRTVDEIQRKAHCCYIAIQEDIQRMKWEEEQCK